MRVKSQKGWVGTVVASDHDGVLVTRTGSPATKSTLGPTHWLPDLSHCLVRMTHDRNGQELRKHLWVVVRVNTLTEIQDGYQAPADTSQRGEHLPVGTKVHVERHTHGWAPHFGSGEIVESTVDYVVVRSNESGNTLECRHRRDYWPAWVAGK